MEKSTFGGQIDTAPPTFRTPFASLSLHRSDRLRLLQFPPPAIDTIRDTIRTSWPRGLQDERPNSGSLEFKLKGYPWDGKGDDAVLARRFMHRLFGALAGQGWILSVSTEISRRATDKSTLLFRKQIPAPAPCEWMSIAFSQGDRLRFIDAPPDLVRAAIQALGRFIQSHKPHRDPGVYELKLREYPWMASGSESMEAQSIVLVLVEVLEAQGFVVAASIDQKKGGGPGEDGQTDVDTWHCSRVLGWEVGMPVFHGR